MDATSVLKFGTQVQGLSHTYVLAEPIGRGGFGETFVAHVDGDPERDVVAKFLRLDRLDSFKALELFEREAKVLASLDHPSIPSTHDFFAWDGERAYGHEDVEALPQGRALRWVMIQSRAPGRSLAARIDAHERMSADKLEALFRRVLGTLEYLHGLSPPVVHRDIKPANLVLSDHGRVSLVDFGAIQDKVRSAHSVASTSVGTFGFLPMEQVMGQARPASDLYALAVTVLVAATHRKPEQLPVDEATSKIDLDALSLDLSPRFRNALDAMLEPIAGQRVQSAREVVLILNGTTHLAKRKPKAVAAQPEGGELARPKHGGLWNFCIGGGVAIAVFLYVAFFDKFSETELVEISAFWVAPIAFGIAGKLAERAESRKPLRAAAIATGLTLLALFVFLFGIFPAL